MPEQNIINSPEGLIALRSNCESEQWQGPGEALHCGQFDLVFKHRVLNTEQQAVIPGHPKG